MMRVKDVMSRELVTIGPETTVEEAIQIATDNAVSGLPVVDEQDRLLGIVTEFSFLQSVVEPSVLFSPVGEVMTRDFQVIPERMPLRRCMTCGAALLPFALLGAALVDSLPGLLAAWALAGAGMSLVQTPAGRVVEASCNKADRSAFFSAQFSLTHGAWLVAYPTAGGVGAWLGLGAAFAVTAIAASRSSPRSSRSRRLARTTSTTACGRGSPRSRCSP